MTGDKNFLADYQSRNGGTVNYGDGVKNNVVGI